MLLKSFRHRVPAAIAPFGAAAVLLLVPAAAQAEVRREILTNAEPTNLVNITPVRIEENVVPGERFVEELSIFNDSSQTVNVTNTVIDLGPPEDPTILGEPLDAGTFEFGASSWISVELDQVTLAPFEKVTFDVTVDPPDDAPVGASYGGIQFDIVGGNGDASASSDQQVALKFQSILQILLTVPGDAQNDLKFLSAKTRDSFHVGDTSFVSYGLRYRNDGNVTEHVSGKVVIESLFGNTVKSIDLGERLLIRGATGSDRVVWSNVPFFGVFSATAEIKGDDGKIQRREMGRVVILPPWWVLALIAAALIIPPVWVWWRRRQEWLLYMDDEYWDEEEDGEYA